MLEALRNWLLYRAIRRVQEEGYAVCEAERAEEVTAKALKLKDHVLRSGHLSTVSGRKPKVVEKVRNRAWEIHDAARFLPTLSSCPSRSLLRT